MNHSLVSVIIPVYNGVNFLTQAVNHVLEQNYRPLEIIVIDDGSTDNTAAIAAQLKDKIRYFHQKNSGPASARNFGIQQAEGNVIAFLDVDDLWSVNKLELQVSFLANHPETDIVQGMIVKQVIETNQLNINDYSILETSLPYHYINLGSAIYRKSVFWEVGLFDETMRFSEDVDWFVRAWEQRIQKSVIDDITLYYRIHEDNMTKGKDLIESGFIRVHKKHLDRLRQSNRDLKPFPEGFPSLINYLGKTPLEHTKNPKFTIIANNNWGMAVYKRFGYLYHSPFVGVSFIDRDYLKLLKNIRHYLESPLTFISQSHYSQIERERQEQSFPIGLLGGDVEIYFVDDKNELEARRNWEKRLTRIQWDNIFMIYCRDRITTEAEYAQCLEEFERLDFPYKVAFTPSPYPQFPSTVCLPNYIDDSYEIFKRSARTFNIYGWLDKKYGSNTQSYIL
jgi:uncharacterized protein (DUF1919 family)